MKPVPRAAKQRRSRGSIPYLAVRFAISDEMGFIEGGEQRGAAADMFTKVDGAWMFAERQHYS